MFATREQEAAFWETHDTTDFEDEFTDVGVRFAKNLSQPLRHSAGSEDPRGAAAAGTRERHRPYHARTYEDPRAVALRAETVRARRNASDTR